MCNPSYNSYTGPSGNPTSNPWRQPSLIPSSNPSIGPQTPTSLGNPALTQAQIRVDNPGITQVPIRLDNQGAIQVPMDPASVLHNNPPKDAQHQVESPLGQEVVNNPLSCPNGFTSSCCRLFIILYMAAGNYPRCHISSVHRERLAHETSHVSRGMGFQTFVALTILSSSSLLAQLSLI
jgi:hypothetical protein